MSSSRSRNELHVVGSCVYMCPLQERILREREGLLHKFEWAEDEEQTYSEYSPAQLNSQFQDISIRSGPGQSNDNVNQNRRNRFDTKKDQRRNRKADVLKTVKEFARSAAGLDKTRPADLRPPRVLQNTVVYLCTQVLPKKDEPFPYIYDFVFDRLRSVRQDIVIQRISDISAICILESIVRFHVYSAFRCRREPISTFDPHINRKHLIDCLKRLLWLYSVNDYWEKSRLEFEALYLIVAPDSSDVISRAMSLYQYDSLRNFAPYANALLMCLAYQCQNYAKYFRLVGHIPPNLASYVTQHAQHIRGKAFQAISKSYGIKTCKFPLKNLMDILLYPELSQLERDLSGLSSVGVITDESGNKYAVFNKALEFRTDKLSCDIKIVNKSGSAIDPSSANFITVESICPWY